MTNQMSCFGCIFLCFVLSMTHTAEAQRTGSPSNVTVTGTANPAGADPHVLSRSLPQGAKLITPNMPERRFAVLVAVNRYYKLTSLKYCENDMKALREQLVKSGFDSRDVFLLATSLDLNEHPKKEYIEATISHVLEMAESGDTVIVALSGHGAEVNGVPSFCPMDTDTDDLIGTTIPIKSIFHRLRESEAKFKLMIVDACREERMVETRSLGGPRSLTNSTFDPPPGIAMMQSCTKGEFSYELPDLQHGAFSYFLIEGLKGKADLDKNAVVTFLELQQYVARETKDYVFRTRKDSQNPSFSLADLSDFPIATGIGEPGDSIVTPSDDPPSYEEIMADAQGVHDKLARRIKENEADAVAYYHRGVVYYYQELYEKSLEDLELAVRLGCKHNRLPMLRDSVKKMKEKEKEADVSGKEASTGPVAAPTATELIAMIPGLEIRTRKDGKDAEAFVLLGMAYFHEARNISDPRSRLTKLRTSKTNLTRAGGLKSDHPRLSEYLVLVNQDIDKMTAGKDIGRPVPSTVPRVAEEVRYYHSGVEKMNAGRHADAFRDFNAALRLKPDYHEVLALRAMVYALSNKPGDALTDIKKAISLDPDNRQYRQVLSTIEGKNNPSNRKR